MVLEDWLCTALPRDRRTSRAFVGEIMVSISGLGCVADLEKMMLLKKKYFYSSLYTALLIQAPRMKSSMACCLRLGLPARSTARRLLAFSAPCAFQDWPSTASLSGVEGGEAFTRLTED
jgi:hypothetical protein